jgi:hypothetical protein
VARPIPLDTDDFETLRKRWLNRYLTVQSKHDAKTRTALIQAAQDASDEIEKLANKPNFSNGVRTAQLRIVMKIVSGVLGEFWKRQIPQITIGHKQSSLAAVSAFTETDRDYLVKAFRASGDVSSFIRGQEIQAQISVAHLVDRLEKTNHPLSTRVYRTKRLANTWVQREINSAIVRNAGAKEIAAKVRKSIRPNTPGGVSYAALRLGRTELNNAFHATSVALAQDRPWVQGMVWHLSQTHESSEDNSVVEICDRYADQLFEVNNVPAKPHPQCRCFVTPQVEPLDIFTRNLTAGYYNDWISNAA